jgi:hypothetical protein
VTVETAFGGLELLGIVAIAVLVIACAVVGWDRYRPGRGRPSSDAHPTNEVFIDPETGRRMRVWYDPRTGVREYREE